MVNLKYAALSAASLGVMSLGGVGVASAASHTASAHVKGNIGLSGIPRVVFRQEKLAATAQVLNTTTANVQSARKAKTFAQMVSKDGLTKKAFTKKYKAQLTIDLEAKGYSSSQVTTALKHRRLAKLHHHHTKLSKISGSSRS